MVNELSDDFLFRVYTNQIPCHRAIWQDHNLVDINP